MDMEGGVREFDAIYNSFRREVVNVDVTVRPTRDEFVAGVPDGEERVYLGGVPDRQRRSRARSLEIVVNTPNVNYVISPSGRKRKRLHHGTDCSQPARFSGHGWSVTGCNVLGLRETNVSQFNMGGRPVESTRYRRSTDQPMDGDGTIFPTVGEN